MGDNDDQQDQHGAEQDSGQPRPRPQPTTRVHFWRHGPKRVDGGGQDTDNTDGELPKKPPPQDPQLSLNRYRYKGEEVEPE